MAIAKKYSSPTLLSCRYSVFARISLWILYTSLPFPHNPSPSSHHLCSQGRLNELSQEYLEKSVVAVIVGYHTAVGTATHSSPLPPKKIWSICGLVLFFGGTG